MFCSDIPRSDDQVPGKGRWLGSKRLSEAGSPARGSRPRSRVEIGVEVDVGPDPGWLARKLRRNLAEMAAAVADISKSKVVV